LNNIKTWIKAFRLRTLPLALSCIIMGSSIAYYQNSFDFKIFVLTIITTILLQILSNLANDYGDAIKGTDNENRVGPTRGIQSGKITKQAMFKAIAITSFFALGTGLFLIYISFYDYSFRLILLYLFLGISAIVAAIKYTMGKNPYGYSGLGDIFVFLFFGIVGVVGSYFLYTKEINLLLLLPASCIGLLSTAVLNMNNMRDIENDRASNKNTLVVKIGFEKAKIYHSFLIITASICLLASIYFLQLPNLTLLSFLPFILLYQNVVFTWKNKTPKEFDPELKKIALSTFAIALLFAIGIII